MIAQLIGGRLLESSPRPRRGTRPAVASTAVHAGLVALAVLGTAAPRHAGGKTAERIAVVRLPDLTPARPAESAPSPARHEKPRGFQILQAPPEVPTTVPPVDVTRPATIAEDFSGRGVMGGIAAGVARLPVLHIDPIDGEAVDQSPYLLPGQMGPPYPEELRDDRPDGLVVVRFVVDTLGRVEPPSMSVVTATHPLFAASVRATLDRLRFFPASQAGRHVRVRMEQRFEFHLAAP
jgi:TonB family protein